MSLIGVSPIGKLPIGAINRGAGRRFAAMAAAGVGGFNASARQPQSIFVAAGLAAMASAAKQPQAAMASAGVGTLAGNLTAKGSMVLSSAGAGTTAPIIFSQASAKLATGGAGAFATVMTAKVSSVVTYTGSGSLGSTDHPASAASFAGAGGLAAVSYAFFADAEKAAVIQEVRVAYVAFDNNRFFVEDPSYVPFEARAVYVRAENTIAVVPFENREYDQPTRKKPPSAPNRRRTL